VERQNWQSSVCRCLLPPPADIPGGLTGVPRATAMCTSGCATMWRSNNRASHDLVLSMAALPCIRRNPDVYWLACAVMAATA